MKLQIELDDLQLDLILAALQTAEDSMNRAFFVARASAFGRLKDTIKGERNRVAAESATCQSCGWDGCTDCATGHALGGAMGDANA
jgi:Na+-translocating ferredoxin:NAD+ oxidoreductase RNF subunit RnfB